MAEGWDWWLGDNSLGGQLLKNITSTGLRDWQNDPLQAAAESGLNLATGGMYKTGKDIKGAYDTYQGWKDLKQHIDSGGSQRATDAAMAGYRQQQDAKSAEQQQMDLLRESMTSLQAQQNPYDPNSPIFRRNLQMQQNAMRLAFSPQRQQMAGSLAARGMLGSGMEGAYQNQLRGQQAGQLGGLEAGMYRDLLGRSEDFERQRAMDLSGLAGGFGDIAANRQNQANWQTAWNQGQADKAQARQDARDEAFWRNAIGAGKTVAGAVTSMAGAPQIGLPMAASGIGDFTATNDSNADTRWAGPAPAATTRLPAPAPGPYGYHGRGYPTGSIGTGSRRGGDRWSQG